MLSVVLVLFCTSVIKASSVAYSSAQNIASNVLCKAALLGQEVTEQFQAVKKNPEGDFCLVQGDQLSTNISRTPEGSFAALSFHLTHIANGLCFGMTTPCQQYTRTQDFL